MQRVAGGRSGGTPGVVAAHAVVKKIALSETSLKPEAPAAVTLDFNAGVEPALSKVGPELQPLWPVVLRRPQLPQRF